MTAAQNMDIKDNFNSLCVGDDVHFYSRYTFH